MRKLLTILCFLSATASAADLPLVVDPVINATPPGSKVTAGYMTLVNETDTDITITRAFSPTIPKIEIHLSSMKNDVAKMEKQESVTVKAGETLEFKHGSYHFMLMELTEPLVEDQLVDMIIDSSVGEFLIEMPVKRIGAVTHNHGEMDNTDDDMKHTGMDHSKDEAKDAAKDAAKDEHADHTGQKDMKKDGDAHKAETKVIH